MKKSLLALMMAFVISGLSISTALADTYYIAPTGNDASAGTSPDSPWGTFNRAWQDLYPGDTLILMDGVYYQTLNPNQRNGEPDNPITIRAQNDGKAIIEGEHTRVTVKLGDTWPGPVGSHYVVEGIIARNSSGAVYEIRGDYNILRRVSGYNANTDENTHVFTIWADNILLEDCIAAGTGRKMIMSYQSEHNVIRRCFAAWGGWDGRNFCGVTWPNGQAIQIYHGNYNIIENSISFGEVPDTAISVQANGDQSRAIGNKVLGSIAIASGMNWDGTVKQWGDTRPGPTSCPNHLTDFEWPNRKAGFSLHGPGEVRDNLFQDVLSWGNARLGFVTGLTGISSGNSISRATIINNGMDNPQGPWPGQYGGVDTDVLQTALSNFEHVTNSRIENIFVSWPGYPNGDRIMSSMTGEGARLSHRYENGVLTDQPLWPWPMESRVQAELGISVTDMVLSILAGTSYTPDTFVLSPSAQNITMVPNGTAVFTVSVNSLGTFDVPVELDIRSDSQDLQIQPASVVINPPGQVAIRLHDIYSGTGTTDRMYEVFFTGQADGIVKDTSVTAVVQYPPPVGSFTLSVDPISVTMEQGSSTKVVVAVEYVNGLSGEVQIVAESSSPHLLVSPTNVDLAGSGASVIDLDHIYSDPLPPGVTYQILISAIYTPDIGEPIVQSLAVDVAVRAKESSGVPTREIHIPFVGR